MAMLNAAKGLKHVIQNKEKFIEDLDSMTKDWKDEYAKGIIDAIKDFTIRDIGSFEWILGEIQTKKTRVRHDDKKRK